MSLFLNRIGAILKYIIDGTNMGYTSFVFLACLPVFFAIFFLLRGKRAKCVWILIANIIFYTWSGGLAALWIVLATAVIVYLAARKIESVYDSSETKKIDPELRKKAKRILILAMIAVVGVWVYVKIGRLIWTQSVFTFRDWISGLGIIVPLGISYYSLSMLGYLLDVFWRKTKPEHDFIEYFTVVTYFPHIVQGPISRYQKLFKQIDDLPGFDYKRFCFGLQLMLYGLFKKMVLADRISIFTTQVFGNLSLYNGFEYLVALILCTFQLYMDFSGCVDIARGISQAIGIDLDQNFNHPFFSKSAEEFWRRWHITLGTWFKDYIYFPILVSPRFKKISAKIKKEYGEKQQKVFSTVIPLGTVWIMTGLWHGTGWNYLIWGIYYGTIIISSTLIGDGYKKLTQMLHIDTKTLSYRFFQCVRTGFLFMMGRLITVPATLKDSARILRSMLTTFNPWIFFDGSLLKMGIDFKDFMVIILGLVFVWIVSYYQEKGSVREMIARQGIVVRWTIYYIAIFSILILGIYGPGYDASAFIYGQF